MNRFIINLPQLVEQLPRRERALFRRIFDITLLTGSLSLPRQMMGWVTDRFGPSVAVKRQKIIRITNRITGEEAIFNALRALRPIERRKRRVAMGRPGGAFCNPLTQTPSDLFGRVRGKHCVTASNIAKYDYFHGLIIFDEHDPFLFDKERVADYIDTALAWFEQAHRSDPAAIYPFFMWNCGWRSGATIDHGHIQLTLTTHRPYARIEKLRQVTQVYARKWRSDYWADLFHIHSALGLGIQREVPIMAYLTPVKEKELLLVAREMGEGLKVGMWRLLNFFYDLGVRSFNLVMLMPPLVRKRGWADFPYLVRILDRGDPADKASDIGGMELWGSPVIAGDPFKLAQALREWSPKT